MTPKEAILRAVENGSKAAQVVVDAMSTLREACNRGEAFSPALLEKMVEFGEIVEVEYVLPGTNRAKSFYLPRGTDVRIIQR